MPTPSTHLPFSHRVTVIQESTKAAAIQVIQNSNQELLIEFKSCWKLDIKGRKKLQNSDTYVHILLVARGYVFVMP